MSTKKVIFSNPGDVIDFVKIVEKYPFDMDMKRGSPNTSSGNYFAYSMARLSRWPKRALPWPIATAGCPTCGWTSTG